MAFETKNQFTTEILRKPLGERRGVGRALLFSQICNLSSENFIFGGEMSWGANTIDYATGSFGGWCHWVPDNAWSSRSSGFSKEGFLHPLMSLEPLTQACHSELGRRPDEEPALRVIGQTSPHFILRLRRGLRRGTQELHQSCSRSLAHSLLEEISRGFHHAHLLCDRRGNPLIQRDAIFLRQALSRLLDRDR